MTTTEHFAKVANPSVRMAECLLCCVLVVDHPATKEGHLKAMHPEARR